jgi:hypothetical protein
VSSAAQRHRDMLKVQGLEAHGSIRSQTRKEDIVSNICVEV